MRKLLIAATIGALSAHPALAQKEFDGSEGTTWHHMDN